MNLKEFMFITIYLREPVLSENASSSTIKSAMSSSTSADLNSASSKISSRSDPGKPKYCGQITEEQHYETQIRSPQST